MTGWHLDDDMLRRYVERTDSLAEGASAEQHLLSCEPCRARVTAAASVTELSVIDFAAVWDRTRDAVEVPRPSVFERLLRGAGLPAARGAAGRGGQRLPRRVAGRRGRGPGVRRARGGGRARPRGVAVPVRGADRALPGGRVQLRPAAGPGARTGTRHAVSGAPADPAAHDRGSRARVAGGAALRAGRARGDGVRLAAAGGRVRRGGPGRVDLGQPAARGHRGQLRLARGGLAAGGAVRFAGRGAPGPGPGGLPGAGGGFVRRSFSCAGAGCASCGRGGSDGDRFDQPARGRARVRRDPGAGRRRPGPGARRDRAARPQRRRQDHAAAAAGHRAAAHPGTGAACWAWTRRSRPSAPASAASSATSRRRSGSRAASPRSRSWTTSRCSRSGPSRPARHAEVRRVLDLVGLSGLGAKRIRAMSGGQRRRVSLAQALLGSPPVLILDEPTTGVDPEQRVVLRAVLAELARTSVVVLSTHQTEDVAALCERVIVLDRGRVRYDGPVTDLTGQAAGRVWLADEPDPAASGLLADRHRPVPQRRRPRPGRGRARRAVPRRRLPAAARRDHRSTRPPGRWRHDRDAHVRAARNLPRAGHVHRARRPGDAPARPQPGLPVRRRAHRVRAMGRPRTPGSPRSTTSTRTRRSSSAGSA